MRKIISSKLIVGILAAFLLLTSVGVVYAVRTAQECITYCGEKYGHDDDLFAACYYGCLPVKPPK